MGHQRLGTIPTTRKWNAVVERLVASGDPAGQDVNDIAALTLDAAATAFEKAKGDLGLGYTFYLLTQIALASRGDDWQQRLARVGIHLTGDSSIFDLTCQMQAAIDDHIARWGTATDISEMAKKAAGEALSMLARDNSVTLFGSGGDELRAAIRDLSTRSGFSRLGQRFFGLFSARFLNFYLSRVTAGAIGSSGIPDVAAVSSFNEALRAHCEQSALIARDFCGQWYAKTEHTQGIDPENTTRFMAVALQKLSTELAKQRAAL